MHTNTLASVEIYGFLLYFCELFCDSASSAHPNEIKDNKI